MGLIVTGIALGFMVSIPPGPNSALCMSLASGGVRRAIPLITGAALTDAAYSLLAASGILFASRASSGVLSTLIPFFLLGAAILVWAPGLPSGRAAVGIAVLNPATAAIWIGLSSLPAAHALSTSDLVLRPLPVAFGTATWFTLLALLAARASVRLRPEHTAWVRRLMAMGLGVAGLVGLIALL